MALDKYLFKYNISTNSETMAPEAVFETLKEEKKNFGKNDFIEVSLKKVKSDTGETEFLSIARGYYLKDGSVRYKKSVTIPLDPEVREFVAKTLKSI